MAAEKYQLQNTGKNAKKNSTKHVDFHLLTVLHAKKKSKENKNFVFTEILSDKSR